MAGLPPDILRLLLSILQWQPDAEMPQLKTCCISATCSARAIGTPYVFVLFQRVRRAAINKKFSKEGGKG
jgi:hypothetical protein